MCGSNGSIACEMVGIVQWLSASMLMGLLDVSANLGILGGSMLLVMLRILLVGLGDDVVGTTTIKKSRAIGGGLSFPQ